MTPLRVPRDTPGFDPWRGKTPQPVGLKAWVKLVKAIAAAWRAWREGRQATLPKP